MLKAVLAWKGKDPNSQNADDLKLAEEVLVAVRPYVRMIQAQLHRRAGQRRDLHRGGWSGDILQARDRAAEANQGVVIKYNCRRKARSSGSTCTRSRRRTAPSNAHAFINFMMKPRWRRRTPTSSTMRPAMRLAAAGGRGGAQRPGVYRRRVKAKLFPDLSSSDEFTRLVNRS